MSATWWKVSPWYVSISPVEVTKVTASFVWTGDRRHAISSSSEKWFPTWEEAHSYLVGRTSEQIKHAEDRLARARADFDKLVLMQKP